MKILPKDHHENFVQVLSGGIIMKVFFSGGIIIQILFGESVMQIVTREIMKILYREIIMKILSRGS